jgi:hypothetical protein
MRVCFVQRLTKVQLGSGNDASMRSMWQTPCPCEGTDSLGPRDGPQQVATAPHARCLLLVLEMEGTLTVGIYHLLRLAAGKSDPNLNVV